MKEKDSQPLSRREVLKKSTVAAAATVTAFGGAPALVRGQNLNSQLQLASIGSDGKGHSDIKEMSTHDRQRYVSFCDVDTNRTLRVQEIRSDIPIYQDFREMLAEKGDEIDAVTVSTPDHMHAYCAITAMKAGKHVYCQKPLTHTVWEARQMARIAKEAGVITRMGNQIHSHQFYRTAVRIVQSGAIGKVSKVESFIGTPGHGRSGHLNRPKNPPPVPDHLDWDLWVGVAPMRPYGGNRVYHPWGWRDWQDFGSGAVGDFGCHILDPVFTALKITGFPDHYVADHSGMNDEVWPAQTTYKFTVPGTEFTAADSLPITWNDGGRRPSKKGSFIPANEELPPSGSILFGETGTLVIPHVQAPRVYRPEKGRVDEYEMLDGSNHYHGWIDGCLDAKQPSDGFDYGALLTETVQLGNIAIRFPEEKLRWDAAKMEFSNKPEANRWVSREYRDGWDLRKLV